MDNLWYSYITWPEDMATLRSDQSADQVTGSGDCPSRSFLLQIHLRGKLLLVVKAINLGGPGAALPVLLL